jgi:hypothetical protein
MGMFVLSQPIAMMIAGPLAGLYQYYLATTGMSVKPIKPRASQLQQTTIASRANLQWYPVRHRGKIMGMFVLSQPIAMMIAGPLAGLLLPLLHRVKTVIDKNF